MNIAIVEDDDAAAKVLLGFIERYSKEESAELNTCRFTRADEFLNNYKPSGYAVVLMDIQMPGTNGMDAAFQLRKLDKSVSLLFITSMVQQAQIGYEVDAVGFMVKPVSYYDFALKFKKALEVYSMNEKRNVTITVPGGMCRISVDKLMYVEIVNHKLRYHLVDEVLEMSGSLSVVEKELESYGLLRCNSCYLVNPKFIRSVRGLELSIGDETLRISRPKRQQFITRLTEWFSGGGVG